MDETLEVVQDSGLMISTETAGKIDSALVTDKDHPRALHLAYLAQVCRELSPDQGPITREQLIGELDRRRDSGDLQYANVDWSEPEFRATETLKFDHGRLLDQTIADTRMLISSLRRGFQDDGGRNASELTEINDLYHKAATDPEVGAEVRLAGLLAPLSSPEKDEIPAIPQYGVRSEAFVQQVVEEVKKVLVVKGE